jgi:hypothetical protein
MRRLTGSHLRENNTKLHGPRSCSVCGSVAAENVPWRWNERERGMESGLGVLLELMGGREARGGGGRLA